MILGSIRSFFVPSLYYLSENASQVVPLIDDVALLGPIPSQAEIVLNSLLSDRPANNRKRPPMVFGGRGGSLTPLWAVANSVF